MQRLDEKAFGHFRKLHDCVNTSFEEMRQKAKKKLREPETSIRWHFALVVLVVFLSWFFGPGSSVMTPIKELIQANGVSVDGAVFLMLFGFGGWVIAVMLISGQVYWRIARKPDAARAKSDTDDAVHDSLQRWIRSGLLLIYSVVILPALPFLLILGPSLARGANTTSILISYVLSAAISLVAWLLMFGLMTMVSGGVPHILFMLLSSVSREKRDALIPGYINMVQDAACQVVTKGELSNLTADDWQRIETIARWKFDGVNGRLQAFSLGVGALGLLGILALLFSQEEIRSWLRQFWNGFMTILGIGGAEYDVSAVLVLVIVGIVFVLAARYFARSYIELRILEAMGIICALAVSGFANQPPVGQAEESSSPPAPALTDTAPSSDAAVAVAPVASVASGSVSDVARSFGDSSSSATVPTPFSASGGEASGDARLSANTTAASAYSSGKPLNAAPSSADQALATMEASPSFAAPANGTPEVAQSPGDSSSGVADPPDLSEAPNDPAAHADHRS